MTSSPLELVGAAERPGMVLVRYGARYLSMSASAYHLFCAIESGATVDDIAITLSQRLGRVVPVAEITTAYDHVAAQLVVLEREALRLPRGFWVRWTCVSAGIVNAIARWSAYAFHPICVFLLLSLCLGLGLWSLPTITGPTFFDVGTAQLTAFWPAYSLVLISILAHEFGHASACKYFGVPPQEIGFALYWVYPVFYSNVNGAWQLSRWQRVVVDVGGLFFQGIIGIGYVAWYQYTGSEAAHLAAITILFMTIFTLNPVLKFDGYWIVADALNLPNLKPRMRQLIGLFVAKIRGRGPGTLPWSRWTTSVLIVCTIIWVSLLSMLMLRLIPAMVRVVLLYPAIMAGTWFDLVSPPHRFATGRLQLLLSTTPLIISLLIMSTKLGMWLVRRVRQWYHQMSQIQTIGNQQSG